MYGQKARNFQRDRGSQPWFRQAPSRRRRHGHLHGRRRDHSPGRGRHRRRARRVGCARAQRCPPCPPLHRWCCRPESVRIQCCPQSRSPIAGMTSSMVRTGTAMWLRSLFLQHELPALLSTRKHQERDNTVWSSPRQITHNRLPEWTSEAVVKRYMQSKRLSRQRTELESREMARSASFEL